MPFDEDIIGLIIGFGLVVVVPLVAILTAHQRRMVELIHKVHEPVQSDQVLARLDAMQRQMNEMRDRQNEILLQVHERPQLQSPPSSPSVEERIKD